MDVKICDICEDRYKSARKITKIVGSELDPAGSKSSQRKSVDLCKDCHIEVLQHLLYFLSEFNNNSSINFYDGVEDVNNKFFEAVNEVKEEQT